MGEVKLIASATAYGVTRADTLPFTIGLPLVALVTVQTRVDAHGDTVPVFPASSTLIAVGGDVVFTNQTSLAVDVVFDDPTNVAQDDLLCDALGADAPDLYCSSGNIAAWSFSEDDPGFGLRYRQLRAPGTYHYHDSRSGAGGTITVQHD